MIRIYFRYDRRLLGDLCRVAAGVLVESFRVLLAVPQAQPGLVVCVHTYGDAAIYHASVRIGADDATGRENLARYLIRAPFSGEKITYNANEGTVIYKTKRSTGSDGNFETFDPLDFLAADFLLSRLFLCSLARFPVTTH